MQDDLGDRWQRWDLVWMLAFLLLALVLRLFRLGEVPPGLHVDEAHNGVDALRIIDGARPIFLEANNGRDVLYSYVQAPLVAWFGPTPWALRLASVLLGSLTVPLTYVFVRGLPLSRARTVAVAAAALTAVSFWHLQFSRIAIRGAALPLVAVTVYIFLWRGIRSGRRLYFALGGLALGLSLYTHPAARVLPAVPIALLCWVAATDRTRTRAVLAGLGWFLAVALLTSLPLASYVMQHSATFLRHPVAVSVLDREVNGGRPVAAVVDSALAVAAALVVRGSTSWYHNLSGRAVFESLTGALFVVGLAQLLRDLLNRSNRQLQHVAVFVALCLTVLALPTVLTAGAPNYSRAIGLLPIIFLPPALALERASRWAAVRAGRPKLAGVLVALALGISGLSTVHDYFVVYARAAEPQQVFGMAAVEKATLLRSLAAEGHVYPSALMLQRSVLKFLTHGAGLTPLDLSEGIVVPADGPARYAFAADEEGQAASGFAASWPTLSQKTVTNEDGVSRWLLFDSTRVPPPASTTIALLENGTQLLGETLRPLTVEPGEAPQLILYWRSAGPLDKDYTVFVHIVAEDGSAVGQHDKQPLGGTYPTSRWQPGDLVVDRFGPLVSRDTPPGTYAVLVGLYDLASGDRVPILDAAGLPMPGYAAPLTTRLRVVADGRGPVATSPGALSSSGGAEQGRRSGSAVRGDAARIRSTNGQEGWRR